MSRKFNINQNPFEDCKIYKSSEITIEPGVTVLVGCNGAGKTTLLRLLKDSLKKENIPYISFDNRTEGGGHAMSKAAFVEDFDLVANLATASEGEQIMINLGEKAASIGRFVSSHKELDEIWVFMDAVDSGFSIDNVIDLKEYLFNTILSDCKVRGKTVYIVCTANSYEMCNGENCFDVTESKYIRFDNYDEYKRFIILNKEKRTKENIYRLREELSRLRGEENKMNNEWEILLSEIQLAARKNLEARIATGKVIMHFRTSVLRKIPMKNPETGQYTEQYAKAQELENKIWHFCKHPTSANVPEELKEELKEIMLSNKNERG